MPSELAKKIAEDVREKLMVFKTWQLFSDLESIIDHHLGEKEVKKYSCSKCGKLRTKSEGGTVFTVCDECWDEEKKMKVREIIPGVKVGGFTMTEKEVKTWPQCSCEELRKVLKQWLLK